MSILSMEINGSWQKSYKYDLKLDKVILCLSDECKEAKNRIRGNRVSKMKEDYMDRTNALKQDYKNVLEKKRKNQVIEIEVTEEEIISCFNS